MALSGFDFTQHVGRVCADMAARVEELRHIDMSRVAVSFRQTRKRMPGGLYASLTPLRFAGGQPQTIRRGRKFAIQRVEVDGREMLYVLNFYLPRFLDLGFREKLTTIAHESCTSARSSTATCGVSPGGAMPTAIPRGNSTPTPGSWPSVGWPAGRRNRCTRFCNSTSGVCRPCMAGFMGGGLPRRNCCRRSERSDGGRMTGR